MKIRHSISIFLISFLLLSSLFMALPEKGYSGVNIDCCQGFGSPPCPPQSPERCCEPGIGPDQCLAEPGETIPSSGECLDSGFCSGFVPESTSVPTLSEWGLIAIAAILGIIGFIAVRRRKGTT